MAGPEVHDGKGRRPSPRVVGGAVLAVVASAFILANREQANVSFLVFDADVALWLALVLAFGLGLAVGALVVGRSRSKAVKGKG